MVFLACTSETKPAEDQQVNQWPEFPSLAIRAAVEDQGEEDGALLTFRTPELLDFSKVSKKCLYKVTVKVLNRAALASVRESKWFDVFAPGSSPRGSWMSLYKPPIEKCETVRISSGGWCMGMWIQTDMWRI